MKWGLLFVSMLFFSSVFAQQAEDVFYFFDANDNPVSERGKASTFEVVSKENDTTYVVRYYQNYGSMLWQQTFKDAALSIPNGRFVWYSKNGVIDSTGIMLNGVRDGEWDYFDIVMQKNIKEDNGKQEKIGANFFQNISVIYPSNVKYFAMGKEVHDASNALFAEFSQPMLKGWMKYLKENLNPKIGQYNLTYAVSADFKAIEIVSFTIAPNKTVDDVYFFYSEAYPYDKEVLRVIKNAQNWLAERKETISVPLKGIQKIIFPR